MTIKRILVLANSTKQACVECGVCACHDESQPAPISPNGADPNVTIEREHAQLRVPELRRRRLRKQALETSEHDGGAGTAGHSNRASRFAAYLRILHRSPEQEKREANDAKEY
jgi:hypothetical protein